MPIMDPKALMKRNIDILGFTLIYKGRELWQVNTKDVHETLHARRCLGERILQARDGGEYFAKPYQDITRRLYSDMNIIGTISARHGVIWRPNIDFMLDDSSKSHRKRGQAEANGDTSHGIHWEAHLAKERVKELVQNGDEYDDDDGVDILHFVVGHTMQLHAARLAYEI